MDIIICGAGATVMHRIRLRDSDDASPGICLWGTDASVRKVGWAVGSDGIIARVFCPGRRRM